MRSIVGTFRTFTAAAVLSLAALFAFSASASAQEPGQEGYTMEEVISTGHQFFGSTSGGLAQLIERAFRSYGLPNGYILGQEAAGAFFGGLRFGEGTLFTKNAGQRKIFWQGPSLGFDIGGDGARTMMLVYNLPSVNAIYGRFGGISGSAYLVGGLGMTVLARDHVLLVPVKTGVGARLGINLSYLKLTPMPTWNPF
ncbi:DUF1134 domain-containing protein [Jiella sp. MQZ9-1]|uniref:DUF1134 domain-containing protein n=1 Tax=Jiella flava TaxID=2816857 RepID=A0A939JVK5_9HYPH|nr:DUF1134 domain-containing protein [Jiella flava]MBO0664310.1 DUF1134 domain-containing protein [Jiella flava]MCD2472767.1 DUF1134 domain-containing protein [Jiella flava]